MLTGTRFKRTLRVASVSCLLRLRLKCSCVVVAAAAVVVAAAGNPLRAHVSPPTKQTFLLLTRSQRIGGFALFVSAPVRLSASLETG